MKKVDKVLGVGCWVAALRRFFSGKPRSGIKYFLLLTSYFLLLPAGLFAEVPVAVSILPEKTFVHKIAGDLADVTVMVPPGASPENYDPKPSQMKRLGQAKIYFAIGVPFERAWLPRFRALNPQMKIVDITEGIHKVPMASHHHHSQSPIPNSQSRSFDPHVWLSPPLVKTIARNIAEALEKADPNHREIYEKNLAAFLKQIHQTDRRLKKILAPCKGEAMMVFHPSWGYFARTYGLRQIPIEIEGKSPKPRTLAKLIQEAKEEGVSTLFVQPEFSKRSAEIIARSIGAKVVEADPLAADWSRNLLKIARQICTEGR